MGNRLSSITTRTGDDGTTGLGDGTRVEKTSLRICAIGDVDELNSHIGAILAHIDINNDNLFFISLKSKLLDISHDLFNIGGELCLPDEYILLKDKALIDLDEWIVNDNANLSRLQEFILPGGSVISAQAHIARTICRRAERSVLTLHNVQNIRIQIIHYLNRLSDWLFIISRCINKELGIRDILWQR
jgi:cob(I)alamin adenosyltransferase